MGLKITLTAELFKPQLNPSLASLKIWHSKVGRRKLIGEDISGKVVRPMNKIGECAPQEKNASLGRNRNKFPRVGKLASSRLRYRDILGCQHYPLGS